MSAVREPLVDAVAYANADALLRLLGGRAFGVAQNGKGGYAGERPMLTRAQIARHFADLETFGLMCNVGYLLGFDVDERFEARRKLLAMHGAS